MRIDTSGWSNDHWVGVPVQLHPEQQRDDERLDPYIPPRGLLKTNGQPETADRGRRCVAAQLGSTMLM